MTTGERGLPSASFEAHRLTSLIRARDAVVRPQTSHEILTRALSFYPGLASPTEIGKSSSASPQPEHVVVNKVGVGLRPARKIGPRVEKGGKLVLPANGAAIDVVYAYG